jgi:hypothetical protein
MKCIADTGRNVIKAFKATHDAGMRWRHSSVAPALIVGRPACCRGVTR